MFKDYWSSLALRDPGNPHNSIFKAGPRPILDTLTLKDTVSDSADRSGCKYIILFHYLSCQNRIPSSNNHKNRAKQSKIHHSWTNRLRGKSVEKKDFGTLVRIL